MRTNPDIGPDQTPHSSARSSIECLPRSSAPLHTAKPMLTESRPKTVFANSLCARQRDLNRFELPRGAKMAKMAEKETPRRNSAAQTSQTLRENVLGAVLSRPSLGKVAERHCRLFDSLQLPAWHGSSGCWPRLGSQANTPWSRCQLPCTERH